MPKRSEVKLTKRTVEALEVEKKDAVFWDRDLAGFGVRVHVTGRKVYVVQSRRPGGAKRVSLGRHGEMSCDEVRKRTALLIDRIKRGEDPIPEPPEAELTVAGLAERFMRTHVERRLKPATVTSYRSVLDKYVLPALGGTALGDVGGAEVTELHHRLRDTPSLANMAVHLLSRMFALAEAWGLTPPGRNPCRRLRCYRTRKRERFLMPGEYRRWPARRILDGLSRKQDNPWVIAGQHPEKGLKGLHHYWRPVRERAGLGDVRIHDLRHSYA